MTVSLVKQGVWLVGMLGITLLAARGPIASADEEKPPNFVIVFGDDWGRHASAYARSEGGAGSINDLIRTPNFDRIAREGVLFTHAFVSSPSCTPCRSAFLSGQHFWRTGRGAILRGAVWDESIPTFPLLLHAAGYHIGQTYKVWSPGTPNDAPFGGEQFAYEKAGTRFNKFSTNVTEMVEGGMSIDEAKQTLYDEGLANFSAFLAERKPDQPFCYWFGPTNVHRQWKRGSGKALWGINPDDFQGKLPKFLPDVPEVREDLADYFGEIQALDAMLGQLFDRLKQAGDIEGTMLIISGDHGAPGFPYGKCNLYDFGVRVPLVVRGGGVRHGRIVDDLVSLVDIAPTILHAAGIRQPDSMTGQSLRNVLVAENSGRVDPDRTAVFTGRERHVDSAREGCLPYPQRAIRTRDYLYIVNFEPERWPLGDPFGLDSTDPPSQESLVRDTRITLKDMDAGPTKGWLVAQRKSLQWGVWFERAFGRRPREELYLLRDDPDQVRNVAADPKYDRVRRNLEKRLMDELVRTSDPRVTGDRQYFETPPLAGPAVE